MTKQDVINRVSTQTKLDPTTSRAVIETFFEVVRKSLTKGEPIYVRQFGSFLLKARAEKPARDLNQHKAMLIAAHVVPAFRPSPAFIQRVRAQERVVTES